MNTLTKLLLALSVASLAPVLNAVTVVSWGPGTDIVPNGDENMSFGKDTVSVNFTSYSNPTVGPDYYPNNTGKTPNFYGATRGISEGSPFITGWRVDDDPTNNRLFASLNANPSTSTEMHAIYIWTKNDFLEGSGAPNVSLDGISYSGSKNTGATSIRYVIELYDSTFYVSGEDNPAGGTFSGGFVDPTTLNWFNYDPTTDFTSIGSSASLSASDFDNLTAAGIYMLNTVGGPFNQIRLHAFSVDATIIPEPSTYAAMAGAATLLAGMIRRRRAVN